MRKRRAFKPFAFLAAIAPALFPREADAETQITTTTTTPVLTSVVNDDLRITSAGTVDLTAPGVAVTVNSSHDLTNEGRISIVDSNGSTSVLLNGGNTSDFTNKGVITNLEVYEYTDADSDGDMDGAFALGTNRYGVRLTGASPFIGNLTQSAEGTIQVEGNNSAAVSLESGLNGNVTLGGGVSVIGNNSYGVRSTGIINGNVELGAVGAVGGGAIGASLENDINGALRIEGQVSANGFRFTSRPSDDAVAKLDADDKLQGGPAVKVTGNVTGGIFVNAAPTETDSADTDEDDDGLLDADETTGSLQAYGATAALQVGDSGGPAITIGNVSGLTNYTYGIVNDSSIGAVALLDGRRSIGVRVENADLTGGLRNKGSILGGSFEEDGVAVWLGSGAIVNEINNAGSIQGVSDSDLATFNAYGIRIDAGANAPVLRNTGTIIGRRQGEAGDAVAVFDGSNTLHLIENSGTIQGVRALTDDADDTDDADTDPENEISTGNEIALDLHLQTTGTIVRQIAPTTSGATALIQGDVLFGSGADVLDVQSGSVLGDISFGAGADQLLISGGSVVEGLLSNSGGLDIGVSDGRLNLSNLNALSGSTLNLGANGVLELQLDPNAAQNGSLTLTGNANFESGSAIDVVLRTPVITTQDFNLITASSISGDTNIDLKQSPYLYDKDDLIDLGAGTVGIRLTRKDATGLGLNPNQSAFYENFFTAALGDSEVMQTLLGLGTQQTFNAGFNQFMPNATGAQLEFAQTRSQAMTSMLFSRYFGPVQKNREIYAWAHELSYSRDREATATGQGFEGFGFGFAGGIDGPMGRNGYKGYGLAFASDEIDEKTGVDRPFTTSSIELMAHAVQPVGDLLIGGRVGVGYDRFKSDRRVVIAPDLNAPSLSRRAEAEWSGGHISANLRAALPMEMGWLKVRPEAGIDAIGLWEQDYEETGGGAGIDLAVDAHQSARVSAAATLNFGTHIAKGGFVFNPELTVGARVPLLNDSYETNARFVSATPANAFSMIGDTADETALIAGAALTVDGQIGSLRLEAQGESADGDTSVAGRVVLRLTF